MRYYEILNMIIPNFQKWLTISYNERQSKWKFVVIKAINKTAHSLSSSTADISLAYPDPVIQTLEARDLHLGLSVSIKSYADLDPLAKGPYILKPFM